MYRLSWGPPQANAAAPPNTVRGTVLLNSAGAMNNKGIIGDWRILALYPLLLFIDFLLSIPAVSAALFNNFRWVLGRVQLAVTVMVRSFYVDICLIAPSP